MRQTAVLILAGLVLVGVGLGQRVLGNNDEARFAVLGQAVLERGEWVFPEIGGAVYRNKPLLLAWLIALASWLPGRVTELTAVLPSAAAAIVTALVVRAFARSLFGPHAGMPAALVALTTQGVFVHARMTVPDMVMTAFITASLWMLWEVLRGRAGWCWAGFYLLAVGGFWTKGPAGLMPILVALVMAAGSREARERLRLGRGLALVAALVAPWWLIDIVLPPSAIRRVVALDQLTWYLPRRPRLASVITPVEHALSILAPWVLVLPAAVAEALVARRERPAERPALGFALACLAVAFVAIAMSQEQRFRYWVPLAPLGALLVGWWWATPAPRACARLLARLHAVGAGLLVLALIVVVVLRERLLSEADLPGAPAEVAVLGGALVALVATVVLALRRGRSARLFAVAWAASAVLLLGMQHWETARYNAARDYRGFRAELQRRLPGVRLVASSDVPGLSLTFYFESPVTQVERLAELRALVLAAPGSVAVATVQALGREPDVAPLRVLWRDRVAERDVVVLGPESVSPRP